MGRVINALLRFDQHRVLSRAQIEINIARDAAERKAKALVLEQQAEAKAHAFHARAHALLRPHRLEIAPLFRGSTVNAAVLELLYCNSNVQDDGHKVALRFLREHRQEVEAAMHILDEGIAELQQWIKQQDWPMGYDRKKLSYLWINYSSGWKPALIRLIKVANK